MAGKPGASYAVGVHIVQNILDYIEENLLEALTPAGVAGQFFVSVSAVNHLFAMVCDTSIMEYVRNRRLSLAGQALLQSDTRIIDLAFQYSYETPEAFSKAFARFHGFPPSVVRRVYPPLRQYAPLRVKVEVEGGWADPTNREFPEQDNRSVSGYHGPDERERRMPMETGNETYRIRIQDMTYQEDWKILRSLAQRLDEAGIPFKVDGKTMIFAHGLEFKLEKICLTFLWNEERRVLDFFGSRGQAKEWYPDNSTEKSPAFKYFDAQDQGMKIRCMFYGGCGGDDTRELLYRNTDRVEVDGHAMRVQSLEFYYQNGDQGDAVYAMVEEYLKRRGR
ncbi:MAG TPA: AraC family transcriptional regulator [Clostridia bacterium]|nr:AraC family transcriptional regulator [Clostridia bacterium]